MWDAVLSLEDMIEICSDGYLMSLSRNEVIVATPRDSSPNILTAKLEWIHSDNMFLVILYNLYGNVVRISIHVELYLDSNPVVSQQ
jgi:hypothetical protein